MTPLRDVLEKVALSFPAPRHRDRRTEAMDMTPLTAMVARGRRAVVSCVGSEGGKRDQEFVPTRLDRDEDLLEGLRQGEPTAAESLVNTYGDRAYRLATRIIGNGQDAEEVVQDALWAVVRKIDSFRGESALGSWLFRIVVNGAYQKLRSRQNRRRDVSWDEVFPVFDEHRRHVMPMRDWSPHVNDPSVQRELRAALTVAIDLLPAAYRTVLVLRDVKGLSNFEIAGLLGLSVSAVKTRVHRARLFLRTQLSDAMATLGATAAPKDKS
jgi:RNA polymerase sigma-70 factor, ECF subfamily